MFNIFSLKMLSPKAKRFLMFLVVLAVLAAGYMFIAYKISLRPITTYGNVDVRSVTLSFLVPGRIKTLKYEEGDRVSKGDVVAILEKQPLQEDVDLAKSEVAKAEAALSNAKRLYERRRQLLKNNFVSQGEFDDAQAARDQAIAQLEGARSALEQNKLNLRDAEIHAPEDGIITTRIREPGSVVAAGTPVYTMALYNPVWVRSYIDEPNLGNIYEGQLALVFTDSGDVYEGQVGFISPQAEFTPKNVETTQLRTSLVYRFRVVIDNPNNRLRQGMPVTVKLEKPHRHETLLSSSHR